MRTVDELAKASEDALALVARQTDVREAEVFVSSNSAMLARLNYPSHIPCNGVEEPKSTESYCLGIQAVFDTPDGRRIGFGSEPSDPVPWALHSRVVPCLKRTRLAFLTDLLRLAQVPKSYVTDVRTGNGRRVTLSLRFRLSVTEWSP